MRKREQGLTLIALIVTIIVMIILAGIAISAIKGNSGIINQAHESKNKSERQEIIESAKSQISDTVVENVGTDITRSQLKEILDKYFENVPDDYTLDTELTTKSEYGDYVIKVSEIYNDTAVLANNEDNSTTSSNTSSTNGGSSDNSGSNNSSTNNSNNSGTNSSTQNTSSTNSNGQNSASTGNSVSTGTDNSNANEDPTNNTSREPEEIDVTGVELDNKSVILDLNGKNTIQLNATPIPNNANKNTKMKWTSKKKTVATVTQDGMVTGKNVGNSTIMAASKNGKSAECLVVCQAKITGITVNPVTALIQIGETTQLTATIAPNTVTEKITWKSSNTDVAKVDNNGNVTGIGKGVVEIIAQNPSGTIQAICTVTVSSGENRLMMAYTEEEKSAIDEYLKYFEKMGNGEGLTEEERQRLKELNTKIENMASSPYLRGTITRDKIESIKFKKGEVPETGIVEQFDVSENENNSIIGYYTDENNNELYELTIVSQNEIITNKDSTMLFGIQSSLQSIDFENLFFKEVNNMRLMFWGCSSLTNLDVSKFDTSQVTDMNYMFVGCSSLTNLDVSKFDTSQVTNMSSMFGGCSSLTSLDVSKFDTSQVTDMNYMFGGCSSLTNLDVSKFDTSQVTNMEQMFFECSSLTSLDLSKFDTSQVTDMNHMFDFCSSLTNLDVSKFDTSKVTNMAAMFDFCSSLTSLDVSKFDTSQVTNMNAMFESCNSLTSLDLSKFDTSKVTGMRFMFYFCNRLTSLDVSKFDTSKVTDMSYMFGNCSKLSKIYVSEYNETTGKGWTTKNVTDSDKMFYNAENLVGGNGTKFNSSYTDATYARIDKEGEPGYLTDIEISTTKSYVGYYADVDGDGTVDGIIFADLLHGKSGQWGDSDGTYTIPTIESTKVKSYKISQEDYTNQLGGTSKIIISSGEGEDRFYVMALTDIGPGTYSLGCSMSGTTTTFGRGKTNTQKLIGEADLNSSLKEQIQPKVNKGWFIPSKEEWSAFGEELGITKSNYSAKGLNSCYWSSSKNYIPGTDCTWRATFINGYMFGNYIGNNDNLCVRLVTTF